MQMKKDAETLAGVHTNTHTHTHTHTDNLVNKEIINIISTQNKPIN